MIMVLVVREVVVVAVVVMTVLRGEMVAFVVW